MTGWGACDFTIVLKCSRNKIYETIIGILVHFYNALSPINSIEGQNNYGNSFFWRGKSEAEHHQETIVNQMSELPLGISERVMTRRLKFVIIRHATIVSVLVQTLDL